MMTPEQRYQEDHVFRILVDSIERMLHKCDTTPSEIRIACMLAQIHYEQYNDRKRYNYNHESLIRDTSTE